MFTLPEHWQALPPDQKAEECSETSAMDQIDAVEHLGAPRARNGLGDAEELLVYLLVNPFQLDCKFVAELSNTISLCSD